MTILMVINDANNITNWRTNDIFSEPLEGEFEQVEGGRPDPKVLRQLLFVNTLLPEN